MRPVFGKQDRAKQIDRKRTKSGEAQSEGIGRGRLLQLLNRALDRCQGWDKQDAGKSHSDPCPHSQRPGAIANMAIIAAELVTAYLWQSAWPDLIVGVGIAWMNADAAREVWHAAREEHEAAES